MAEYAPNSHKSREDRSTPVPDKKVEKVISGSAKTKKKNGIRKLTDVFISEDVDDVKSYIFEDVIVPAVKDIILDAVRALLGTNGKAGRNSSTSRTSYSRYYEKENDRKRDRGPAPRTGYSYDDIILDTKGEAEDVLSRMDDLISTYGLVSVADLYDLCGMTGNHTDNKYGWFDIRSAESIRVRDGYLLKLPRALPLN